MFVHLLASFSSINKIFGLDKANLTPKWTCQRTGPVTLMREAENPLNPGLPPIFSIAEPQKLGQLLMKVETGHPHGLSFSSKRK